MSSKEASAACEKTCSEGYLLGPSDNLPPARTPLAQLRHRATAHTSRSDAAVDAGSGFLRPAATKRRASPIDTDAPQTGSRWETDAAHLGNLVDEQRIRYAPQRSLLRNRLQVVVL
jgi:hypothetical protein